MKKTITEKYSLTPDELRIILCKHFDKAFTLIDFGIDSNDHVSVIYLTQNRQEQ